MWQTYCRAVQAAFEHTLFGSLAEEGICSKHVGCKRGYHKCMLPKRTMQVAWLSSEIPVNNGCWLGDSIPAFMDKDGPTPYSDQTQECPTTWHLQLFVDI
jgi:hypothetical protein